MSQWTFINNDFVPEQHALLHISDLSIQRGYGVFDYLKTLHYKPVFQDEHLQRFYFSANEMHLPVPLPAPELKKVIAELMQRNNMDTSGIRLTLTGGYSPDGYTIAAPNLLITQLPLTLPSEDSFARGIRLVSYEHLRPLASVKTISYIMAVWLQTYVKAKGAQDVLYHHQGIISECPRANFFMVKEGVVVTPDKHILEGITRAKLLTLAGKHYKVEERLITLEEVRHCQEAFITSTTKQVLPVNAIDDFPINHGQPGPITQHLFHELQQLQEG